MTIFLRVNGIIEWSWQLFLVTVSVTEIGNYSYIITVLSIIAKLSKCNIPEEILCRINKGRGRIAIAFRGAA